VNELVVQFKYETDQQRLFCETMVQEIAYLGRLTVAHVARMGECLNEVRSALSHGRWLPWLDAYFGWSDDTARRYMKVGTMFGQIPQIAEFGCVDLVLKFADLPIVSQQAVIEQGAYRRTDEFDRVAWDASMRAHLTDGGLDYGRRHGDVLQAIEDARDDPVLAPVAKKLYAEHREAFARLADREPADIDTETGIDACPPAPTGRPNAQLVTGERYWICEWVNETWIPVAPVQSYVQMWPGPSLLAAFPKTNNGPAAVSWGTAAERAVCRELHARTTAERFEEVVL